VPNERTAAEADVLASPDGDPTPGHGGNVELKNRKGAQYQIGILQVVDVSLPDHSIEEIESWWKRKLMTREHGLNRN